MPSLYSEPYKPPNPPKTTEMYDGKLMKQGEAEGTKYMIRRLSDRYFGMVPGRDVKNVNAVEHSTVVTEGKTTAEEAEESIRTIAKHLPEQ